MLLLIGGIVVGGTIVATPQVRALPSLFSHVIEKQPPAPPIPHAVESTLATPVPQAATRASSEPPLLVKYGPLTFAPLVKKVIPAVVNIAITEDSDSSDDAVPPQIRGTPLEKRYRAKKRHHREEVLGAGSGFIIDPTGYIVTNNHVVGDADDVTVSLSNGKELPAHIVGTDSLTDVAVIKVDSPTPLPFVTWGNSSKVDVGDWILVAGNPFAFGSSVSAGIVSARGRDLGAGSFDDFLQLDAPINPGNSGGPAFNMRGEVVAMNAAIVSPTGGSVGIGFGIPSEIVAPIVAQLCKTGHIDHGWLGVTLDDDAGHVNIVAVDKNSPAMKAGIKHGDRLVSAGSKPVESARAFLRSIAAAQPASTIDLVISRKGKEISLSATIGKRPANEDE